LLTLDGWGEKHIGVRKIDINERGLKENGKWEEGGKVTTTWPIVKGTGPEKKKVTLKKKKKGTDMR